MSTAGKSSYVAIKLPFKIGTSGTLETTSDYKTIWQDRVRSVLLTAKYERVNRPEFGSTIYEEVHNGVAGINGAEEMVTAAVYRAFADFLAPALTVTEVITNYDFDSGALSVSVSYKLPNNTDDSLTLNRLSINRASPPSFTDLFTEGE